MNDGNKKQNLIHFDKMPTIIFLNSFPFRIIDIYEIKINFLEPFSMRATKCF